MTTFLWTLLVCLAVSVAGRSKWLARGEFPRRTSAVVVGEIAIRLALLAWISWLLAQGMSHD